MVSTTVYIKKYPIRLGQFLKIANIAQDGIEAKLFIINGDIKVNDIIETRRGRQLQGNDIVETSDGNKYILS